MKWTPKAGRTNALTEYSLRMFHQCALLCNAVSSLFVIRATPPKLQSSLRRGKWGCPRQLQVAHPVSAMHSLLLLK